MEFYDNAIGEEGNGKAISLEKISKPACATLEIKYATEFYIPTVGAREDK